MLITSWVAPGSFRIIKIKKVNALTGTIDKNPLEELLVNLERFNAYALNIREKLGEERGIEWAKLVKYF